MWKLFIDWFKAQFTLTAEVSQLRREVEELRRREEAQAHTVEQLLFALQRESDQWRQNEILLLKLELELVKIRAGLPPSKFANQPKLGD